MSMPSKLSPKKVTSPAAGSGVAAVRQMLAVGAGNSTSANQSTLSDSLMLKGQKALEVALLGDEAVFAVDAGSSKVTNQSALLDDLRRKGQRALETALLGEEAALAVGDGNSINANQSRLPDDLRLPTHKARPQTKDNEANLMAADSDLKLRVQKALESVLLPEEKDVEEEMPSVQRATSLSGTSDRPSSAAGQEDRERMECHVCGYKSVPQWLNDEAHCLKCQTVLKRRPSVHQRHTPSPARTSQRRFTSPARPRSQTPSSGGMVGPERFFYDKTTFTGTHAQGHDDHANNSKVTLNPTLLGSLSSTQRKTSIKGGTTVSADSGDDRSRVECNVCGYKCVPQWLNDEAHCLKCQAVLKRRPSVHQKANDSRPASRSGKRRASTPARICEKASSRQMVGPERFFYDKSTYTGAHAHGGPK